MQCLNKTTVLGASLLAVSILVSACGGGSSTDVSATGETSGNATGGANGEVTAGAIGGAAVETINPIDVTQASIVSTATKVTGGQVFLRTGNFSFPEITNESGSMSMTIPGNPPPVFAARRTLSKGTGQTIGFGDSVVLKYDMFSWAGGELVESSSLFEEAHIVEAGVSDRFPIPEYLAKSLLGRSIGDTIQVVLPVGTDDLPTYLDPTDAYVLLVELL